EKKLERVKLKISKENSEEIKEIPLDFLFIEIGSVPNTVLLKDLNVKLDERNFILCNEKQETSISGVFACGDITSNIQLRQAITAAAQGAIAAHSAYLYLQKKK
ncbi:MAG: thioredoxin reductase (NADPH), partial [Candidatus Iainarchaeum archaeon]